MRSEASFFNKRIFLKNIVRFWPIWAVYLLLWLFVMPAGLWSTMSSPSLIMPGADIAETIITEQIYYKGFNFGSSLTAVFGILAAMSVFSYLFIGRSAGFFHALPVKREGLFITNYVSGLTFLIVPVVVAFILTAIVESICGYLNFSVLLAWLGIVTAMSLFFYSFGVFCAMLTGNILALPVFYCILNLVAVGLEYLIKMVLSTFVFGMTHNRRISLGFLSPYYQMNTIKTVIDDQIACWNLLICYAAVGIVFAAIALLLYRKRRIETAGDVIALRPARPIFKYGAAFSFALLFSFLLHNTLGQTSIRDSFWRILICMLLAGFVGYYAADMLLKKNLHVIKSGIRGWLVFSAVLAALVLSFKLDLYGYEKSVPDAADISQAYFGNYINISSGNSVPDPFYGLLAQEAAEISQVAGLHKSIVDSSAELKGVNSYAIYASARDTHSMASVGIYYILKDGSTMLRSYMLPVTAQKLEEADSPASRYRAIMDDPDNILSRNFPRELTKNDFQNGTIYPGNVSDLIHSANTDMPATRAIPTITLSQDQSYELYQAIVKDIKAGNIGKTHLLANEEYKNTVYTYSVILSFSGNFPGWRTFGGSDYVSKSVSFLLETASVNTKEALKSMGLLDESQLITQGGKHAAEAAERLFSDIPDEIVAFYDTYMEACKKSTKEAVQYTHFENNNRNAYLESNDRVVDYTIENIEKINDNLYAFTVNVASAYAREGKYEIVYNFVGIIDGKLYAMNNAVQIPNGIRDHLEPDKYKYNDPDNLGPGS